MQNDWSYMDRERVFHGSVPLVMGTRFDMLVGDISRSPALLVWEASCKVLEDLDRMLNRFDPSSETSLVNSGKTTALSPELQSVIEICAGYWLRTCGLFDITRKDFGRLRWQVGAIRTQGMDLDFGGMAKGLALRHIQDILERRGVRCAYVDFGGSTILGVGHHPYGTDWKVDIMDPYSGRTVGTAALKDSALSTSGNSPGHEGHIINPSDGTAYTGRKLLTVCCPDPLDAEILSTALYVADEGQARQIKDNFPLAEIKTYVQ